VLVKELLGPIAAQPFLQDAKVLAGHVGYRDLVRPPGALDREAVDLLGARPPLRRTQDDHRPARTFGDTLVASGMLDLRDLVERLVQCSRKRLVHGLGLIA
jgi:hypothetical protein